MKQLLDAVKLIFSQSFYRNAAILVSGITAYFSYWLFYKTTTIQTFLGNMENGDFGRFSYAYGIAYVVMTAVIIVLAGVSAGSALWLYKHSAIGRAKTVTANAGGLISAAFGMGCPVCGAFLFSALGIVGGMSILPLQGLELKLISVGLLGASTWYSLSKVSAARSCTDCLGNVQKTAASFQQNLIVLRLEKIIIPLLIVLYLANQFMITNIGASYGLTTSVAANIAQAKTFLGFQPKAAFTIIAPKLNADGKTTSLTEQSTITEVPGNPTTGDALADAKVVMSPKGKPFYAPEDISFDDPINAQKKWGVYEKSIKLTPELEQRYQTLISTMTCGYCCGSPTQVTVNKQCGCAHAIAARGYFRYMLQTYGNTYTNEQLIGEAFRWWAVWYPKGMLEDYLLATGNSAVLPHQTHGGAGADGKHGLPG